MGPRDEKRPLRWALAEAIRGCSFSSCGTGCAARCTEAAGPALWPVSVSRSCQILGLFLGCFMRYVFYIAYNYIIIYIYICIQVYLEELQRMKTYCLFRNYSWRHFFCLRAIFICSCFCMCSPIFLKRRKSTKPAETANKNKSRKCGHWTGQWKRQYFLG
jgi:hypothetical protein